MRLVSCPTLSRPTQASIHMPARHLQPRSTVGWPYRQQIARSMRIGPSPTLTFSADSVSVLVHAVCLSAGPLNVRREEWRSRPTPPGTWCDSRKWLELLARPNVWLVVMVGRWFTATGHVLVAHLVSAHAFLSRCLGGFCLANRACFSAASAVEWLTSRRVPALMQPNHAYCSSPAPMWAC